MSRSFVRAVSIGVPAAVVTVLLASGLPAIAVAATGVGAPKPTVGTTRYIIRTIGGVPSASSIERATGGVDVVGTRALGTDTAVVAVRGTGSAATTAELESAPRVLDAVPDRRFTTDGTAAPVGTSDSWFRAQVDLWDAASIQRAGGYGVDAPRAWQVTLGRPSVVVAVLDTGITAHPDLAGASLAAGRDFVTNDVGHARGQNVYSHDGDGWDADPTDPGDWCDDDSGARDSSWHGTFVTGEIAARHDTGGVAGEAPGVTIEPVRVLGGCGGLESDQIAAIEWATGGSVPGVPVNPRPAQVVSMSLGGDGACDAPLQAAIDHAIARGATVVASAGNDDRPLAATAPADCAGVVSVVATTRGGDRASYSNYGTADGRATIAAPGGSGQTGIWGDLWTTRADGSAGSAAVGAYQGTSMAAPRVSAAAALLLSVHPGLSPAEVTARLRATATPFPRGSDCTRTSCGAGVVNAGDLLGVRRRFVSAVAPHVTGTDMVGRLLTAHAGTWHLAPTTTHYRWYRGSVRIAGAVHRTYRLRAADEGHRVHVRVTVLRAGTATATATSAGTRIRPRS